MHYTTQVYKRPEIWLSDLVQAVLSIIICLLSSVSFVRPVLKYAVSGII